MKEYHNIQNPKIGDVYLVNFEGTGSEQRGLRPGVIFQNNTGNKYSPNVVVLPLTSSIKKINQPTHVVIPKEAGLKVDSMVLCENPSIMSREKLGQYITTLPNIYISRIAVANILASSAISYVDPDELLSVRQAAVLLNGVA